MYVTCLSAFLIAGPTATTATPATDDVATHSVGAQRAIQAFTRFHSLADLESAVYEMVAAGNTHALKPETFVAQRRTLVRGWAKLFKVIEQSYDPTYDPSDPNNRPILGLPDPKKIRGEQERSAAAAAAATNSKKVERASYYHDLSVIDMLAQSSLKVQLGQLRKVEPDGTDADFAALDGILQEAGLSSARRTKINVLFYARPMP